MEETGGRRWRMQCKGSGFVIHVHVMRLCVLEMRVHATNTVFDLKWMLQPETNIPLRNMAIVFKKRELNDDITLDAANITRHSEVWLWVKLQGG